MLLSVTTPSGQRIGLEVDPTDKVEDIKAKIQEKTGCAPCRQSLSYNGKPLKDGDTLLDFIAQGEYSAPEDSAAQDESGAPGDSAAQDETSAFGDLLAQGGSGVPGDFIIQDEYSAPGDFIVREDGAAALSSVRPTVRLGDRGQAVVELQTLLASRGFSPGPADGIFGPLTQNAVLAFQRANGLAADGIVGPITWGVLLGGGGTEPPPPPVRPTLRFGDRGEAVRELQTLLASRGFSPGPADGIFGSMTQNAVMAFQRDRGLAVDGIVGPITWGALLEAGPTPPNRPTLRIGDRGEAVMELQTLLASRGYSPGPADGIFGPMTQNAVMAFQRDRGLAVDGIVGPITWGALLEAGPPPPNRPTLRIGDRGEAVRELQTLLASRGYSPGPADGIFGPMTQSAVMAFQRDRGLTVDGIVGPITWGALLEAGPTPPVRPTLRIGDRGEAVRELQELLIDRGYSPGPIDGIFGPMTQSAVMAFQRDRGLTVDGIVGPITWGELLKPPGPGNRRESLTYLFGGTSDDYLKQLSVTKNSITTVCPDFFDINADGSLRLAGSNKLNAEFINALHGMGIKVTPFLSNHWNRELGIAALNNRGNLSGQIASAIAQHNLDGVNVNIENLTEAQRDIHTDFTRLLRQKLPQDKIVSTAVAANPNGWTTGWHGSYDYKGLAQHNDYLMIMNYDESFQGGPEGPVSSSGFFERSIQFALNQGVPRQKIVSGIPFFGRYWQVGALTGGIGLAARDVEYLLANYTSSDYYDESTQSALAIVTIKPGEPEPVIWGGRKMTAGTYRIWYDSPRATRFKLEMINKFDLLGAGSWCLGQEITLIWDFYTAALNNTGSALY